MAKKEEIQKLSGMEPGRVITDSLTFDEPGKIDWDVAAQRLNDGLTKNQAWAMCQALQPMLRAHDAVLVKMRSSGRKRPATELQGLFSQATNKIDMTRGLALILCLPTNLQHFTQRLTDHQVELFQLLLDQLFISESRAKKVLHTDTLVVVEKQHGYYYYNSKEKISPDELMFLNTTRSLSSTIVRYGYRQNETFVTLPAAVYPYFLHALRPETSEETWFTRQSLPSADYQIVNLEVDSVAKFALLQSLLKANKMPLKQKGVGAADVKRAAKSLALSEIFADDAVKGSEQEGLRARFYVNVFAIDHYILQYRSSDSDPIEKSLRRIFYSDFERFTYHITSLILPHIKGIRRQFAEVNTLSMLLSDFLDYLRSYPQEWICIGDLLTQLSSESEGETIVPYSTMVYSPSLMSDLYDLTNEYSHQLISADSFVSEFGLATLQSLSLMLGSVGMAEVAVTPQHRFQSPFARAEFIRLTDLGRYALNVSQEYAKPHFDQTAYFELDPERLIIRSLVTPNPYEQLLKNSSVLISKNRYETSASSFLAHCKSRDDVEKNIDIFKQFISSELPPLWKDFFAQLLQHCHPLKKDATAYYHFTVQPDDSEFIRLVTTDEKLRRLVIRAEDYRILVRASDLVKFEERLKKHGYLL